MVKVATCQCGSTGTPEENMQNMIKLFKRAVENQSGLDLVVFPEYSYYSPLNIEESKQVAIDLEQPHPFLDAMRALAKEYKVNFIPGSFVTKAEDGKVKNTCVVINREGEIIGKYDKVHLMVAASYDESSYVSYGDKFCVVDTDFGTIGVMVCYDLRFPEQARTMCLQGAEILVVPAMFPSGQPLPTRVDDWDVLVRSTALTNMTYVVTSNQFGLVHNDAPFGRSGVTDPKGLVVSMAGGREDVVYGFIDLDYQRTVQENFGVWRNRRPELYKLN